MKYLLNFCGQPKILENAKLKWTRKFPVLQKSPLTVNIQSEENKTLHLNLTCDYLSYNGQCISVLWYGMSYSLDICKLDWTVKGGGDELQQINCPLFLTAMSATLTPPISILRTGKDAYLRGRYGADGCAKFSRLFWICIYGLASGIPIK